MGLNGDGDRLELSLQWAPPGKRWKSKHAPALVNMFGLRAADHDNVTIIPPLQLTLTPGLIVFITGASGGGKSSLLKLIRHALVAHTHMRIVQPRTTRHLRNHAVIDAFGRAPLKKVLRWLSLAGLAEARVMLTEVADLSEGQRHRLAFARTIARAERHPARAARWSVILADEFGATLDRPTAHALAHRVRKWISHIPARAPVTFIAATTHDDLLEALDPDVLIDMPGAGQVTIIQKPTHHAVNTMKTINTVNTIHTQGATCP